MKSLIQQATANIMKANPAHHARRERIRKGPQLYPLNRLSPASTARIIWNYSRIKSFVHLMTKPIQQRIAYLCAAGFVGDANAYQVTRI